MAGLFAQQIDAEMLALNHIGARYAGPIISENPIHLTIAAQIPCSARVSAIRQRQVPTRVYGRDRRTGEQGLEARRRRYCDCCL